jgi:hypothetical protein
MGHRWRAHIAALICAAALLALTACSSTASTGPNIPGGSSGTASAGIPQSTATATPTGCAALYPGSAAATSIPGFTSYTLVPTGSVMTPLSTSYGGTGQFTVETTNICFQGALSQVNGPFSGHSSVFASLLGAGLSFNSTFPYDGVTAARACKSGASCFNNNGQSSPEHYISFENLTSPQSGFVTYLLRVAAPPATPVCTPASDYANQAILHTWEITTAVTYDMPPLTTGSTANQGGGYAGGNLSTFCSAGSAGTILSFMENVAQSHGETLLNTSSTSFKVCLQQSPGAYFAVTVTANTGNVWTLNQTISAFGTPTC